jgi:hypothetical protein
MKLVVLANVSKESFEEMIDSVGGKSSEFIDTESCDEDHEYKYLLMNIHKFSRSSNEILLAKFSGRESIVKELGDECSDMIISLSSNGCSNYYDENPVDLFGKLIHIFVN